MAEIYRGNNNTIELDTLKNNETDVLITGAVVTAVIYDLARQPVFTQTFIETSTAGRYLLEIPADVNLPQPVYTIEVTAGSGGKSGVWVENLTVIDRPFDVF